MSIETVTHLVQLADSVAAMEARRFKLHAQLAKLNGEILTSELPRANSGLPLSPPRLKRRRISDFTSRMGGGRLRIGSPKKLIGNDRRAVSGMVRVAEEVEMAGIHGTFEAAEFEATKVRPLWVVTNADGTRASTMTERSRHFDEAWRRRKRSWPKRSATL